MRTARRYLAREIYRSSTVVLVALLGLFTFFALIDALDDVGTKYSMLSLFYVQALELPTRMYDLLPIGLLIGAILALAGLAQRNELVILRVSGVSGMKLLGMLWLVTVPLVIMAFFLSEIVTPAAEIKASEARLTLLGKSGGGQLASGYWFKEGDKNGGSRIINIARLTTLGGVEKVTMYEFDSHQVLNKFSQAEAGRFGNGTLELTDVRQTTIAAGAVSALNDGRRATEPITVVQAMPQRNLETSLTPERLIARILTPERMSLTDLTDYISYLGENHLQTDRQVVALWRKIAYPFTLLVMITIAAPIGFMQTRRGGVGSKVFVGILLGVSYFMLNQLALNVGMLSKWAPWVTALLPSLAALALSLAALILMENKHNVSRLARAELPWSSSAP